MSDESQAGLAVRPSRRRWWQFSVRTLLLMTLIACVPLALLSIRLERTRRQRRAANAITTAGGAVWYLGPETTIPATSPYATLPYDSQKPGADAFGRLVEEATAGDVVAVIFSGGPIGGLLAGRWSRSQPFSFDGQEVRDSSMGRWVLHGDAYPSHGFPTTPWQDIRAFQALEVLSMGDKLIGAADVPEIAKLKQLRCLLIYNGKEITDDCLAALSGLTKLRVLVIGKSQISDDGLVHLSGMTNLEVLELDHASIHGHGLKHLAPLASLKLISLRFTPLEDDGLAHITHFTGLQRLYFFRTNVTDAGLRHLHSMHDLQILHLGKTGVSFQGANAFEKAIGRAPIIR